MSDLTQVRQFAQADQNRFNDNSAPNSKPQVDTDGAHEEIAAHGPVPRVPGNTSSFSITPKLGQSLSPSLNGQAQRLT